MHLTFAPRRPSSPLHQGDLCTFAQCFHNVFYPLYILNYLRQHWYQMVWYWWFRVFLPYLYFLLFPLIFLFWTIGGVIFLNFFRICLNYVNVTFIFSEIVVMIGPINYIFDSIIVSFGVFSVGYHLFQFCFLWEILPMGDCCMMQRYNRQWTYISYWVKFLQK